MFSGDVWRGPTGRAAVGAIVAGPLGVLLAVSTGWPLLPLTVACLIVGALGVALAGEGEERGEAAVQAILPVGAWLVGAAVGWAFVAVQMARRASVWSERATIIGPVAGAFLGGTMLVLAAVARLAKPMR